MMIRFNTILFYFFVLLPVCFINSQDKNIVVFPDENGLELQINFEPQQYILEGENKNIISYFNAIDESNPGSPVLPSKTFFIAIPPNSKVNLTSLSEETSIINSVIPRSNPDIELAIDSSLLYKETKIDQEYSLNELYPINKYDIIGYTWIRDYYCAVLKINTHRYNWSKRNITEMLKIKIRITFSDVQSFNLNTSQLGAFDESLKSFIVNYEQASKFRTHHIFSSNDDSTGNWIDYSKEYVKLDIPNDGLYRIYFNDLLSYGVTPEMVNPKTFKLFSRGTELPIYIFGEGDQSFDPGDYIEFWAERNYGSPNYRVIVEKGEDYQEFMDRYSDTSTVWLTWDGGQGKRTETIDTYLPNLTDSITTHLAKVHLEQNTRLWYYGFVNPRIQLPFWQENKVWTWLQASGPGTSSFNFNADFIVPNSSVFTISRLISWFVNASIIRQNAHKFGAILNSSNIQDSVVFDFESTGNLIASFNSNLLAGGQNTYKIVGMPNDLSTPQKALLDWVDVEYEQYTSATNDSILVNIPSALSTNFRVIKISNISVSDSSLLLYKINSQTKKINSFQLSGGVLTFTDSVGGGDRYYIISESYLQSPIFRKKKQFVNLRDPSKQADYIIVSNKILSSSVAEYANFIINNYNVNVEIVYVEDIYDEFSYGYFKPEPIKDFLKLAFNNWQQPSPSYLVIIGDGTYDYKDFFIDVPNPRKRTLVPSFGNPVSDVWFTTWDTTNTEIQQMFVGRIPANNNEEVYRYLEKHQTYINRGFDEWNKKYLFFSGGDPNLISELNQIKQANDRVLNNVVEPSPVGGSGIHFYKTLDPPSNFGPYTFEEIQDGIDEGGLFISYVGHSGTRTWDNGVTDVDDLENTYDDRSPIISDNGCSTAKFAEPDVDAFGELFINQDERGQAIIYMGNSSLGYTSTAFRMPELFYSRLIVNPSESVGKTHFLAKMDNFNQYGFSTTNRLYNYTNLLLGDPIIKFAVPEKPNFVVKPDFIKVLESVLTENNDSADVELILTNLGKADSDSLSILITGIYSDSTVYSIEYNLSAPLFKDTMDFVIPIFGLVGKHTLRVEMDPNNLIDEISKDDNIASINFLVSSTNLRPVEAEKFYTSKRSIITLLNPTIQSGENPDKIEFAYATTDSFINQTVEIKNLDTLVTRLSLNGLIPQQRYYWRTRLNSGQFEWGATFSFYNEMDNSWLFNKSFRMNEVVSENAVFDSSSNSWALQIKNIELKIISAGSNDGMFASMRYNRQELLPNTFFWGIVTAEIDSFTLQPNDFRYYIWPNSIEENADSLINYIESLSEGTIVAMAISDDAAQTVLGFSNGTPVRRAIESLGSLYIDSVLFKESWSIIGVKGALPGSVPEAYSKHFNGPAIIDTSKISKFDNGYLQLPVIKNSVKWLKAFKSDSLAAGSRLDYFVRGIKSDNTIDTLGTVSFIGDSADLSFIDAEIYPQIDFVVNFTANNFFESPIFKSLGVNFIPPPELATNYQVVSSTADTVLIGEDVGLSFYVYNVGESKADSFKVKVDVGNDDNSSNTIFEQIVDSLGSNERKLFNLTFNTSTGLGAKTFMIDIDSDKQIRELYEDNNFYTVPFYIKQDTSIPSLNISFDGTDILDGDYISPSPEIKIELSDESLLPISDTSAITIFLNDDPIYYASNPSILSISFNEENPKAIVTYTPELENGDYTLKVFGKNSLDNVVDSSGLEKQFRVSNEVKLLEVYNYPNPTSGETHFTFKLSQIPDEVKIKIYTIAGRLIKEINIPPTDLKYDFNKIYWDGRDEDGDILGNGVYLYKVILTAGEKTEKVIQKLAIVR